MAEVLQVFEIYLKKMAGECVEFRVNYDKLTSFVQNSIGEEKFLQILSQFIETLQEMLNKRTKPKTVDSNSTLDETQNIKSDIQSKKVDPSLVQITASKTEIDRRISAFLRKKQLDVDIHNQREFCNLLTTENEYSCARVDAVFLPRVGQKSHITVTDADHENKIMESDNITVDTMLYSLPCKRKKTSEGSEELPYGVEERLKNIKSHLNLSVKTVDHDVYSRIKKLEEKILYLEGLSPEYFSNQGSSDSIASRKFTSRRQTESTDQFQCSSNNDLDQRMLILKEKLLSEKRIKTTNL